MFIQIQEPLPGRI